MFKHDVFQSYKWDIDAPTSWYNIIFSIENMAIWRVVEYMLKVKKLPHIDFLDLCVK